MGDISKHFNRSEFACKCGECRPIAVDKELVDVLEDVRTTFGQPVIITSSYRCTKHNAAVGGARTSMHLTGMAADIQVKNVSPRDIQLYLKRQYADQYGIGSYESFTHIDTRPTKARWNG